MITGSRTTLAFGLAVAAAALGAAPGSAQSEGRYYPYYNYNNRGAPVPEQTVPDETTLRYSWNRTPPRYQTYYVSPNPPTNMTSINYPLVYGAYIYPFPMSRYTYGALPSRFTSAPTLYGDYYPTMYTSPWSGLNAEPAALRLNSATFNVRVPADAIVRFNGVRTLQKGERRTYLVPGLIPATTYAYDVGAVWTENGRERARHRDVAFQAGDEVTVDLLNEEAGRGVLKTRPLNGGEETRTLRPRSLGVP